VQHQRTHHLDAPKEPILTDPGVSGGQLGSYNMTKYFEDRRAAIEADRDRLARHPILGLSVSRCLSQILELHELTPGLTMGGPKFEA
jgi:hypothetical protein